MNEITVLFLASDPINASRLRLGQESRDIRERLQSSKNRGKFIFESRESVRPEDVTQAIFDTQPQIIHFSGHGMESGELCFEDERGNKQLVHPEALARLFKELAGQIKCVLLNACHSEALAKSISEYIPFVIGVNNEIGDKAAIAFSTGFYKALGADYPIEKAYNFGCIEIELKGITKYSDPVLYLKPMELNKSRFKWQLTLNATFDDLTYEQIEEVVDQLRQISGDANLTLEKVESGSVKLTLEGSSEGYERVSGLIDSGELDTLLGITIKKKSPAIDNEKEVTALWADIDGFTAFAESLQTNELLVILNDYFESMTNSVMEFGGKVEKYIGDAVLAVFRAPLPLENNAWMASQTALDMLSRLAELNKRYCSIDDLLIRICLFSGKFDASSNQNQSSFSRISTSQERTIIVVLEKIAKRYDCNIVLDEFTYRRCHNDIVVRELERVQVKNIDAPLSIYELLGSRYIPLEPSLKEFLNLYQKGRSAYLAMNFRQAIQFFEDARKLKEADCATDIHLERAKTYLLHPPDHTWDGVFSV